MSTPNSRAAVDNSGSANHLLSEQIDQQQGCIAFRAMTAQANGASKETAVWTAALADEAFTGSWGIRRSSAPHRAATLEFLAEALQVGQAGLMTQVEGALLMGA